MFTSVLIANRGEIAVRAIRTLKRLGIRSVAVYSEPDRNAMHVRVADEAVALGGEKPADSYLRIEKLIAACQKTGAEAVFPGYGFLSESAEFAEACEVAGIVFLGPTPHQMREFGLKHRARELAEQAGVPLTPGTGLLASVEEALEKAELIGYPVMLKSTAGGGGIGLTRCANPTELSAAFESVGRLGRQFFRDSGVFLERYVDDARHIEVQMFGNGKGTVVSLGERDCSIQRRNQKVIEETPALGLDEPTRAALLTAARDLGKSVNYRSAGTVEFIYDIARSKFYFLEVNTRLQVEHPVTEAVTGLDLIELMLRVGAGESLDWESFQKPPQGAAIEVRLYAEDPTHNFQPSPGTLTEVHFSDKARTDTWVETGTDVSVHYDPLLAKVIAHGPTRDAARTALIAALQDTRLYGIATNLEYVTAILSDPRFAKGGLNTRFLNTYEFHPHAIEVITPGMFTTVQDYPGRLGLWGIGVPPSGPMDDYAFRLANRIVGNESDAAGLECTLGGPSLRFHCDTVVALTGASVAAEVDGTPVAMWTPVPVKIGQVLTIPTASDGCRTYVAIRGGIDVPLYLGSRSTFVLGQFGGHAGRILRPGDLLPLFNTERTTLTGPQAAPPEIIPQYSDRWEIGVLHGPHSAPDYFTTHALDEFFQADWEAHYNSNRLGVRLIGPKPTWARDSGGEAGLHPSNVHDCEYAIGSINFTGDSPVILTRDGPSLGGFVCPVTIAGSELWKIGQVKPGDKIRFVPITYAHALELEAALEERVGKLAAAAIPLPKPPVPEQVGTAAAILDRHAAEKHHPKAVWRQAGDNYILLEYGDDVLDLALRLRVHVLMQAIEAGKLPVEELSPGVRSLQIRYRGDRISQSELMRRLRDMEAELPEVDTLKLPTRVVRLPLAFQDSATLGAVDRYRETVRAQAPWLPSNVEFIRRINGLASVDEVRHTIFAARYMVLGLGDVYLGAPCAVPVDPRHRLLSSKYNPARTFTAEGTVGIGGMYMCIYGMDSPGGYQLIGRTLPIWNKFLKNSQFAPGEPWLLRFFDQVSFYPVSEEELTVQRDAFREGRSSIEITEEVFDWSAHREFLASHAKEIEEFRSRQATAFKEEIAHWLQSESDPSSGAADKTGDRELPAGIQVASHMHGSVWKVLAEPGKRVEEREVLFIIEAMKMEVAVLAPAAGTLKSLHCKAGQLVAAGDVLAVIEP